MAPAAAKGAAPADSLSTATQPVSAKQLAPMHQVERQLLSKNMPVLRESLFQPRPLTFTDKAFMPWMTLTLTNSKWSQQIVNAESTWRSIEEQATQNSWFEGENGLTHGRPGKRSGGWAAERSDASHVWPLIALLAGRPASPPTRSCRCLRRPHRPTPPN